MNWPSFTREFANRPDMLSPSVDDESIDARMRVKFAKSASEMLPPSVGVLVYASEQFRNASP